jgi:hypothetical protein
MTGHVPGRNRVTPPAPVWVRFPARVYASAVYAPRHPAGGLLIRPYVREYLQRPPGPPGPVSR